MQFLTNTDSNYRRNTKIVATLGPASNSPKMIDKLIKTGVNVFRVNFSHGDPADHIQTIKDIRAASEKNDRHIVVLADLQGPKLRLGTFKNTKVAIKKGQTFTFDSDKTPGDETRVYLPHPEVIKTLKKGDRIYLDDGKVRVEVTSKKEGALVTKVIAGQALSDRKGFNLPDVTLPIPALTAKDRKDLRIALDAGVDWIAQSFVQTPADVAEAKKLIAGRAGLIAKIEKPVALKNIGEIIDICDGIMLARGDLGVEIPAEDVPSVQKRIVKYTRNRGKPIIVATQMLESMITSPAPTRAEASDVATAIYDGADAVMLSGETAVGQYPIEAVSMMNRIASRVEQDKIYRKIMHEDHISAREEDGDASDAITIAADEVADIVKAAAIVTYTTSGSTALRMAKQRPSRPIICLTQNLDTARRLNLSYGVRSVHVPEEMEFESIVQRAVDVAKKLKFAKKGQRLVITAGVPFGTPGSTNTLRIAWVS